jgi:hypothetical protein
MQQSSQIHVGCLLGFGACSHEYNRPLGATREVAAPIASDLVESRAVRRHVRLLRRARARLVRFIEPSTLTSQPITVAAAVVAVAVIGVLATHTASVPYSAVVLPILVAGLFLSPNALLVVDLAIVGVVLRAAVMEGVGNSGPAIRPAVLIIIVATAAYAHVIAASRERLGVQGLRGDAILAELRDRLSAQQQFPELPGQWQAELARRAAGGVSFGGDFVAAALADNDKRLEVVVVDVSGKGIDAATRALQLSGALGGILGAMAPEQFLVAANNYVCRQGWSEGFATAVHVAVDLTTGDFTVGTAGHPAPAQFDAGRGVWRRLDAAGPMLGLITSADYVTATGVMRLGDALMLFTDGMIEVPGRDLEIGTDKLLGAAEKLVVYGFNGGAERLIDSVAPAGADDRALVLLWRA